MRAIIKVDVPDWQIGQKASIYFPDTMDTKGVCEKEDGSIWIFNRNDGLFECDECGMKFNVKNIEEYMYCPHCGIKKKGVEFKD